MRTNDSRVELLNDDEGSVALGWVGAGVLYARFAGGLSASLAAAHVARLNNLLGQIRSVWYFIDATALHRYDLVACSAFVDAMHAHRSAFRSVVILAWTVGPGLAGAELASALSGSVEHLTDRSAFEQRLLQPAPFAKRFLDPTTWKAVSIARRSGR